MSELDHRVNWPVTARQVLGTGAISSFVEETITSPSGQNLKRQFLTHPGAVAVVAWDEEKDLIAVVHQYRHPVRMELVEIPAGLLDVEDEDYLSAAMRELAEEAELQASTWNVLVDIFTTPGANEESLRVFLARGLTQVGRPSGFVLEGEEAEMTMEFLPRADLVDHILDGRCQSPSLVSGVLALETVILTGRIERLRPANAGWPARS